MDEKEEEFETTEYEIQSEYSNGFKRLTVFIDSDKPMDPDNPDDVAMALEAYQTQLIKAIKQKAKKTGYDH